MGTSDGVEVATVGRRRAWPSILYTLIFGILSGAALTAIAYYRIATSDDGAALVFGAVALLSWLAAGFLAARSAESTPAGALTGLVSGLLGTAIGFVSHQLILQQYGDAWYQRASQACAQLYPLGGCVDKPAFLANEASLTIVTLIVWPVAALILGLIAGYVGATSASRRAIGDEYEGGTITLSPPLVPSHRTTRSQGIDFPQGDRPTSI
jgi:hypothetical protein